MTNQEYLAALLQTSQDLTRQFTEIQARLEASIHPLEGQFLAFEEIVPPGTDGSILAQSVAPDSNVFF